MPNFTPEELILFLYHELKDAENNIFKESLQSSWTLKEKSNVINEAKKRVDQMKLLSPRNETIASIMQYADKGAGVIKP